MGVDLNIWTQSRASFLVASSQNDPMAVVGKSLSMGVDLEIWKNSRANFPVASSQNDSRAVVGKLSSGEE